MMKSSRQTSVMRVVLIAFVIGLAISWTGCHRNSDTNTPTPSSQPKVVRAAYVPAGYYLPFLVVKHQGLLAKRGYEMELQRYQDNAHMINLFLNGHLDVAAQSSFTMFPTEVDHPGLLKFVYGQYAASYFFMVPNESTITSLADMKDKTIGTWKSPTAVNFIKILLQSVNLREGIDYRIQRFGATEWPAALENSVVPVVYGFDVLLARLALTGKYRYVGEDTLEKLLNGQRVFNGGAFVSAQLISNDPEKAKAIRDALLEAIDIIHTDPELKATIVAEMLLPADVDIVKRLDVARSAHFDVFSHADESVITSAKRTLDLLIAHGVVSKRFDVTNLFWKE